ncbi:MAG TPA: hypothetical protein VFW80_02525 [Gaiellaceae bacterium]|nr:hypothetical protein [Gaiellaceae bacterium]
MDPASRDQGLTEQASEKVQEATSVAQEKASEFREQGSARLRDQVDQRSTQVGSQARSLAEALRRSGNDLGNEGNGNAAQLANQVADRVEGVGSYLERVSGDDVMRDVESFARRRPWMLAGLGLLAGVAAARFMKASSEQRYGDRRELSQGGYSTAGAQPSLSSGGYGGSELPASGEGAEVSVELDDIQPSPATRS